MNVQEHEWAEALAKLRAKYGCNIPEPVDHYGVRWKGRTYGGIVVVGGDVYSLYPADGEDGIPRVMDNELVEALKVMDVTAVCERFEIPLFGLG